MPYSPDVYEQIRRATGEWGDTTYEDAYFDHFLDLTGGNVDGAASLVWQEKAANYAEMVDITEAGSSRKNSQLYAAAHAMYEKYKAAYDGATSVDAVGTYSTTRPIARP